MTARRRPDPTTRRLVAQIGGNARVRQAESPAAMTAPARRAFLVRFERQVDPDGVLDPEVRAAKARAALSEQMARVSLARVTAAARRRGDRPAGECPAKAPAPAPVPAPASRPASGQARPPMTWAEFLESRQQTE